MATRERKNKKSPKQTFLKKLKKNKFWGPILEHCTLEQLSLFCILIGLLPAIEDFSLFSFGGASHLDYLFGDDEPLDLIYWLPTLFLPIGVLLVLVKKDYYRLIAFVPTIWILATKFEVLSIEYWVEPSIHALILYSLFKMAFLYMMIKGHLKTLAFVAFLGVLAFVLHYFVAILFLIYSILFRVLVLAVKQNYSILSKIPKKRLALLSLKSFLMWIPILTFVAIGFFFSYKMEKEAERLIYEKKIINKSVNDDRHIYDSKLDLKENFKFKEFIRENDSTIVESDIEDLELSFIQSMDSLMNIKGMHHYYDEETIFENIFDREKGSELLTNSISEEIKLIAMKEQLLVHSNFELNIRMTADSLLKAREDSVKKSIQAIEEKSNKALKYNLEKALEAHEEIVEKMDQEKKNAIKGIKEQGGTVEDEIKNLTNSFKKQSSDNLETLKAEIEEYANAIPQQSEDIVKGILPQQLVQISAAFEDSDCGPLSVICKLKNRAKCFMRCSYIEARSGTLEKTKKAANKLRDSINITVENVVESAKAKINDATNKMKTEMDSIANEAGEKSITALNDSYERMSFAMNSIKEVVKGEVEGLQDEMEKKNKEAQKFTTNTFRKSKEVLNKIMVLLYYMIYIASLISTLSFLIICIKSYLYVFARVAFAEGTKLYVRLKEGRKNYRNGTIKHHRTEYSIPHNFKETMYVSRKFEPTGRAPKISIPFWTTAIMARLKSKTYLMNEVVYRKNGRESVDFRSIGGAEFIEWNLTKGEEVIFNLDNLVAISASVKISTFVSLRLTSLLFGKILFRVATGPGTIVLLTNGKPITNKENHLVKSVPVERIIAWQKSTRFSVDSELNMIDLYFSNLYLKRTNKDLIVIDADPGNGKRGTGMARFATRFIRPF